MGNGWKLYEVNQFLTDAIEAVFATANELTGEIPDSDAAFLEEVQIERNEKCLSVAKFIKSLDSEADAIADEATKLSQRKKVLENKARFLRSYLSLNVKQGEKLSDSQCVIGWRKSEGVIITDETKLPESVFKIERKPVLSEIKERIKTGEITDGAVIETRQNLTIK